MSDQEKYQDMLRRLFPVVADTPEFALYPVLTPAEVTVQLIRRLRSETAYLRKLLSDAGVPEVAQGGPGQGLEPG